MADINELMRVRKEKEQKLKDNGVNVHPERYEVTHTLKDARNLEDGTKNVRVAGRVMSKRKMGKISFMDLSDIEGKIQLVFKRDDIGEETYKLLHSTVDIGDFIGVEGEVFTTQAGEKSIQVSEYEFLGKALRPLPEKFHGISNQEMLYRERHLDLIMNDDAKKRYAKTTLTSGDGKEFRVSNQWGIPDVEEKIYPLLDKLGYEYVSISKDKLSSNQHIYKDLMD